MEDAASDSDATSRFTGVRGVGKSRTSRPANQGIRDDVSSGSRTSKLSRTSRRSRQSRLIRPIATQKPDFEKKGVNLDSDSDEAQSGDGGDGGYLDELTSNLDDMSDVKARSKVSKVTSRNGPNLVEPVNKDVELGAELIQMAAKDRAVSQYSDEESAFEILAVSKPGLKRQDSARTKVPPASGYTQHRGPIIQAS
jgi:hypothetical protein